MLMAAGGNIGVSAGADALVKAGKLKEQVVAAKPTAEWDATWGTGFIKGDVFVGILYESLKAGR